jgi:phosphoribosylcarboxyaminoimidazole (NCAIR) mutase
MEKNCLVSIVMGSKSDLEVMREAEKVLREFGISCELRVISAHRLRLKPTRLQQPQRNRDVK